MYRFRVIISTLAVAGVTAGASAGVLFVDDDAPPGGTGREWTSAFRYLQDALTFVSSSYGAIPEIRVAQGVYTPDRASVTPLLGDRTATFQLVNGVALKGGYAGLRESDPDARDIERYRTVLSGDLFGNDGLSFLSSEDNSYHVVTGISTDSTAVLEGFTVTAGNANGSDWPQFGAWGGGVLVVTGSPTFKQCRIIGNAAEEFGGGIANFIGASPTITQCTIKDNKAGSEGGGVANLYNSNPTISDTRIEDNVAGRGGGIFNQNSLPMIINSTISGNTALSCQVECEALGAGMYNGNSDVTVVNSLFTRNVAVVYSEGFAVAAGGAIFNEGSAPVITNSTFSGNVAAMQDEDGYVVLLIGTGGGMFSDAGSAAVVTNSIFWENVGGSFAGAQVVVTYSDIQGGFPGPGNISANPMFTDPEHGDYRLSSGSPAIDAADNASVPLDADDLDGDGNLLERTPVDLAGDSRFRDDPATFDTGNADGLEAVVDMGAYEYQYVCPGDLDGNGAVDIADVEMLISRMGAASDLADLNRDGASDIRDLIALLLLVGTTCP